MDQDEYSGEPSVEDDPAQVVDVPVSFDRSERPEIVIGIVSTAGIDLDPICKAFDHALDTIARYKTEIVRVSQLIEQFEIESDSEGREPCNRWRRLMNVGDRLRRESNDNAVCAMIAIMKIIAIREEQTSDDEAYRQNGATIIRQLKHPEEVELLREIYGNRVVIVGVSADPDVREAALREQLRNPIGGRESDATAAAEAFELLKRDENDEFQKHGQHVRDAFEMCDAYIPIEPKSAIDKSVERLVSLLFGAPFITPTKDEMGVWYAFAAKHRSSASGRQVGAMVMDADGEVLVTGCNDAPKPLGGQNWDSDTSVKDHRDFALGYESNDRYKFIMTQELMSVLQSADWLSEDMKKMTPADLAELALAGDDSSAPILKGRRVASLLEFGRIMHAEMAALTTAARRGTSLRDATLYTTTYPCHECMRLIIGAGVRRVVFIDPYPKSLVNELFGPLLGTSKDHDQDPRIVLEPFLGVAPRLIGRVFAQADARKRELRGDFKHWDGKDAAYVGEVDRYTDSVLARELGIAGILTGYLNRIQGGDAESDEPNQDSA